MQSYNRIAPKKYMNTRAAYRCPSCNEPLWREESSFPQITLYCPNIDCKSSLANDGAVGATMHAAFLQLTKNIEDEEKRLQAEKDSLRSNSDLKADLEETKGEILYENQKNGDTEVQ